MSKWPFGSCLCKCLICSGRGSRVEIYPVRTCSHLIAPYMSCASSLSFIIFIIYSWLQLQLLKANSSQLFKQGKAKEQGLDYVIIQITNHSVVTSLQTITEMKKKYLFTNWLMAYFVIPLCDRLLNFVSWIMKVRSLCDHFAITLRSIQC